MDECLNILEGKITEYSNDKEIKLEAVIQENDRLRIEISDNQREIEELNVVSF